MENKKMRRRKSREFFKVARLLMITCCIGYGFIAKSQGGTLTIICNQDGTPNAMKLSELKSVMKGEKQRWSNGKKVSIALMKTTTPIGKNTAQVIYNMSGEALLKYNLGLHYNGNLQLKFFNTVSELEEYVAQTPGAIGVIDQLTANNDIKVITIDGKTQF